MRLLAEIELRSGKAWGPKSKHCAFVHAQNHDSRDSHRIHNPFIYKNKGRNLSESVFVAPVLCYYATVQSVEGVN
jgi:hypothetical protein